MNQLGAETNCNFLFNFFINFLNNSGISLEKLDVKSDARFGPKFYDRNS